MKDILIKNFPHILHGADYNPDQWQSDPVVLKEDMRLMKLANCNEMSVGIFAWAALEPEEGRFDFTFLDRAMDDIYAAGGRVILATPSGARPAWMARKYPEVLRVRADGIRNEFGTRHNHCFTSPVYREKVRIINEKLAERYQDHPALIAWHLSNEYNGECYCEKCRGAFREWLRKKYGTLERLNAEWWTSFWAHTYTDWEQINPPGVLGESCVHGQTLDWRRFVTAQTTDFMKAEVAAVRRFTPDVPVTTNLMGFFPGLDYRTLAREIDFVSWDNYPTWRGDAHDEDTAAFSAMSHDLMRSLKLRPFLLMESTPSCVNWHAYNKLKRPGVNELAAFQALAHGADSVQYFQWRKSRGSSEKFHGAVVDHAGHENTRVFREVSRLGARLAKLDDLVGAAVEAKAAILTDWDNRWALEGAQGFCNRDKKYLPTLSAYYRAFWRRGVNVDLIGREQDFSRYAMIVAPMPYIVTEELGEKLKKYVAEGGILYATYTAGMVNENDLCWLGGFPGAGLREVFGIWNEEIDTLYPEDENRVSTESGEEYRAVDLCELIHAEGARVLASYTKDFYAGMPAYTVHEYGHGRAYYQAFRDDGTFADREIGGLLAACGIRSDFDGELPAGVTSHSRTDGERVFVFLENYTDREACLPTSLVWRDAESGATVTEAVRLGAYGARVLVREGKNR